MTAGLDGDERTRRIREYWSGGDYPQIARLIDPVAAEVVRACGIAAGQDVLDVAAGNGNLAVRAARAGARVVAVDVTPRMLELGRERSRAEGVEIEWVEADAQRLPFADASFDRACSVFGAIFAPDPVAGVAELVRVLRPGGVAGLTAWTREGFLGGQLAINRRHGISPPCPSDPADWGDEEVVARRFAGLADVETRRATVRYGFGSLEEMRDFFERNAPQAASARASLSEEVRAAAARESRELVERHNRATDGSVAIDSEYLLVVARPSSGA